MRQGSSLAWIVAACTALGGCMGPDDYTRQADAEVGALLDKVQSDVLAGRASFVEQPAPAAEAPPPAPEQPAPHQAAPSGQENEPGAGSQEAPAGQGAASGPTEARSAGRVTEAELEAPLDSTAPDALKLDLRTALRTAVTSGRDYTNRKESLYEQGLSLSLTRYNFGPILNGTVTALWNDAKDASATQNLALAAGVTQALDTGGSFTLGGTLAVNHDNLTPPAPVDPTTGLPTGAPAPPDPTYDGGLNFDLTQPLLRGSGYLVSHEALTQGERSMVYAVRDFELFREDYAIGVADNFLDLVSRRRRITNLVQSWKDAVFDRKKSEALRQVDRNHDEDVFGARRREIDAENTLIEARTDYRLALDDFKIKLGLPTNTEVAIVDQDPPFESVKLDEESAVQVALHNRLDLQTAREQLEDTERGVLIAEDALRPGLDLTAGWGRTTTSGVLPDAVHPDDWQAHAQLALELPLNRQAQRNAWRSALIALDRGRRDLQLQFDGVERDVRNQLRSLTQTEQQIELQKEQIAQEQRAVAVMQIRYESGDAGSRDLLDARQSLVNAQNSLIDLLAHHVVARLTLLRTLGVLFLDDDGMWMS